MRRTIRTQLAASIPHEPGVSRTILRTLRLWTDPQDVVLGVHLDSACRRTDPDLLRMANALSALYPKNSEGKCLLDAMLLAVPRN